MKIYAVVYCSFEYESYLDFYKNEKDAKKELQKLTKKNACEYKSYFIREIKVKGMGADGGILYMYLKKPEKHNRLSELIRPFHIASIIGGHQNEHWEAIEKYHLDNDKYFCGTYGTDLGDIPTLYDFVSIVEIIKEGKDFQYFGLNPKTSTFLDLIYEKETRPQSWYGYDSGPDQIFKIIYYYDFDNGETIKNEPIFKMTLKDWTEEVESIVDINEITAIETWT